MKHSIHGWVLGAVGADCGWLVELHTSAAAQLKCSQTLGSVGPVWVLNALSLTSNQQELYQIRGELKVYADVPTVFAMNGPQGFGSDTVSVDTDAGVVSDLCH